MNLNHPTVRAVRAALQEAATLAPVVRRLLDGTLQPSEFSELARACETLGLAELAPIVRQLADGASKDVVVGEVLRTSGLMPTLVELSQLAGEGADLVCAVKALVKGL